MSKETQILITDLWEVLSENVYLLSKPQIRDLKFYILEQSK
tara:strand:- start:508 stop:630 length:123 start_codon:yes stop_codon:yes gene_type:complete